jgi:hypothetical protein
VWEKASRQIKKRAIASTVRSPIDSHFEIPPTPIDTWQIRPIAQIVGGKGNHSQSKQPLRWRQNPISIVILPILRLNLTANQNFRYEFRIPPTSVLLVFSDLLVFFVSQCLGGKASSGFKTKTEFTTEAQRH